MSAEPSPTVIWEDVGPWHGDNNSLKLWRRGRKPLGAAGDASIADGNPPSVNNNKNGSGKYLESVVGAFSSSLSWLRPRPAAANTEESRISPSGTRGREEREGGECRMPAEPCTADEQGGTAIDPAISKAALAVACSRSTRGQVDDGSAEVSAVDMAMAGWKHQAQVTSTGNKSLQRGDAYDAYGVKDHPPEQEQGVVIGMDDDNDCGASTIAVARNNSVGRRTAGEGGGDGDRVRGFHDMICVGFLVSLCLNLGSLTARQEGFFAAEVKCLSPGTAELVLRDLGIWVGWRRAVANARDEVSFDLEDLSITGAAMGVLTAVGHATDSIVNAVGLVVLLFARRKPLDQVHALVVKRLCLASLAMAGWLLGLTVIGFLAVVTGPIGSAAVEFYSEQFGLSCRSSVSVSVDYAYAMTTLVILCQFFIGIVAIPKPSRWSPAFCRGRGEASTACTGSRAIQAFRRRGSRPTSPSPGQEADWRTHGRDENKSDDGIVRDSIFHPI